MCFKKEITTKRKPKPSVAENDIIVYKVLRRDNLGWMYDLFIDGKFEKWKKGFHYTELTPFKRGRVVTQFGRKQLTIFGNAFHSMKTRTLAEIKRAGSEKIVKMCIPKGALYYENEREYVSSEIIYI